MIDTPRCALAAEVAESGPLTPLENTKRTARRLALRRKIERFRESQSTHMPALAQHLPPGALETEPSTWPACETLPLFFPSSLDAQVRTRVCTPHLLRVEDELQFARLSESLSHLRMHLRSRIFANLFKIKNITGQRHNTRARVWQKTIDNRVIASKRRYQRTRIAVFSLRGPGDWEKTFRVLHDDDVRAFNERALSIQEKEEREAARRASGLAGEEVLAAPLEAGLTVGEGRRRLSWIWLTSGGADMQDDAGALHAGKFPFLLRHRVGC